MLYFNGEAKKAFSVGAFDTDRPTRYTLTDLKDLAGVGVVAFPSSRLADIDQVLRERFGSWQAVR